MRKIIRWFLPLLFILFVMSCSKKMSEKEYYDLANQYMAQEKWQQAEQYFEKILQEYPNGVFSSKATFMVGFINANYLKNYDKARKYYSLFLEKYPRHELADDAKYELDHLGKGMEDLPFLKGGEKSQTSRDKGGTNTTSN